MIRHTSSPERSGRLYYNDRHEDNPAAGPIAMRAISAAFMRRARLAETTTSSLGAIDGALSKHERSSAPTPPDEPPKVRSREEVAEPDTTLPRRKLGGVALSDPEQKAA